MPTRDNDCLLELEIEEPFLPADRITTWNPGLTSVGGIPNRTTVFTTISPLSVGSDNGPPIQAALNTCPAGQIVQLTAGTYTFASASKLIIGTGITLRGAGAGTTILTKLNGATDGSFTPGPNAGPVILMIGPGATLGGPSDFTADGVKGSFSITVASAAGFVAGQLVGIDELSLAAYQTDPQGRGQVWASSDFSIVWNKFNPPGPADDFGPAEVPGAGNLGSAWCSPDRPHSEIKEIVSVVGNVITFSTPLHTSYRVANSARASCFTSLEGASVENLTVTNGDDGGIAIQSTRRCWMLNVEVTQWLGEGFKISGAYQLEIRHCYIHEPVWPVPGGGGYAISFAFATSEVLIEDCISVKANKVMVSRCCGAGSVVGYNYMDMSYIDGQTWVEIGINASHMVGSHHVLFEGNYSHNADSDKTHGNSTYMTFFRNHLRGLRAPFTTRSATLLDDATQGNGPERCCGPAAYGYWFNFVGNVLGKAGAMTSWHYEGSFPSALPAIWLMGWDDFSPNPIDPNVQATIIRDGNYDHLTSSQQWHNGAVRPIPNSLYLTAKPAFFGSNPWPWVDPATGTTYVLPAKARFDANTPNA